VSLPKICTRRENFGQSNWVLRLPKLEPGELSEFIKSAGIGLSLLTGWLVVGGQYAENVFAGFGIVNPLTGTR
jgi:hypothetical protein